MVKENNNFESQMIKLNAFHFDKLNCINIKRK